MFKSLYARLWSPGAKFRRAIAMALLQDGVTIDGIENMYNGDAFCQLALRTYDKVLRENNPRDNIPHDEALSLWIRVSLALKFSEAAQFDAGKDSSFIAKLALTRAYAKEHTAALLNGSKEDVQKLGKFMVKKSSEVARAGARAKDKGVDLLVEQYVELVRAKKTETSQAKALRLKLFEAVYPKKYL